MNIKPPGYTLLELIVVIGIIGILVAVSAPGVSDFAKRIAFRGVVDEFENVFRESFSHARSGPFYPLVYISTEGEGPVVEYCDHVQATEDDINNSDEVYQTIGGSYFCAQGTREVLDLKNVSIVETRFVGEDSIAGDVADEFSRIGIEYLPPYGDLKTYMDAGAEAFAYPPEENSEAIKSISLTFSNSIDFETITIWQTGLIERFKGSLEL